MKAQRNKKPPRKFAPDLDPFPRNPLSEDALAPQQIRRTERASARQLELRPPDPNPDRKKFGPDLEEYEREMDEEGLEFGGLTYAEERAGRRSAEARRSTNSDYWWRTAVRQD